MLLTFDNVVKLSDFGLSRSVVADSAKTTAVTGPLRWMAVESLTRQEYSAKSDIWSFAVLLFEVFSNGEHGRPHSLRAPTRHPPPLQARCHTST